MTESAFATRTAVENFGLDDSRMRNRRDHKLRDTLAWANGNRRLPEINQYNHDLAAIIGIYGAGRVDQRQTLRERSPTARTHLALESGWNFDRNPRGNRAPGERLQNNGGVEVGGEIETAACSLW
jgi:hypothetical protein